MYHFLIKQTNSSQCPALTYIKTGTTMDQIHLISWVKLQKKAWGLSINISIWVPDLLASLFHVSLLTHASFKCQVNSGLQISISFTLSTVSGYSKIPSFVRKATRRSFTTKC